jgi:hypothetical protein
MGVRGGLIAIFLAAVVCFVASVAAGPALAGVPAAQIASAVDTQGQAATVLLQAQAIDAPGLGAWQIDIQYDPTILTAESCTPLSGSVCNPGFAPNTARVIGASATGLIGNSPLSEIEFGCDTAGMSQLTLTLTTFSDATPGNPQPIAATILHGTFTCRADTDLDGCADIQEQGPNAIFGGLRDQSNFWDFYDVPTGAMLERDQSISSLDIFAILARWNTSGNPGLDPLSTPPPAGYHTAFDRGPVAPGGDVWDLTAADGSIAVTDIFSVLAQFNHRCT